MFGEVLYLNGPVPTTGTGAGKKEQNTLQGAYAASRAFGSVCPIMVPMTLNSPWVHIVLGSEEGGE